MLTTQLDAVIRDWREDHPTFSYLVEGNGHTTRLHYLLDEYEDGHDTVLIEFYKPEDHDDDIRFDTAERVFGQSVPLDDLYQFALAAMDNRRAQQRRKTWGDTSALEL